MRANRAVGIVAAALILVPVWLASAWLYSRARSGSTARLDRSTPPSQNGLEVVGVQAASGQSQAELSFRGATYRANAAPFASDGVTVWVRSVLPLPEGPAGLPGFEAQGRTSDGQALGLSCQRAWPAGDTGPMPTSNLLTVTVPSGYPATVRWIDITLRDSRGPSARWRIVNLPRMRHIAPAASAVPSVCRTAGMEIRGRAWRGRWPAGTLPRAPLVFTQLEYRGTPSVAGPWQIVGGPSEYEWALPQPPGPVALPDTGTTIESLGAAARWAVLGQTSGTPDYYPETNHWVRVRGELRQLGVLDEPVTFRDVQIVPEEPIVYADESPVPQDGGWRVADGPVRTVRTKSGVEVSLFAPGSRQRYTLGGRADNRMTYLRIELGMRPASPASSLPGSALWRRYKRPVRLGVLRTAPYKCDGWTNDPSRPIVMVRLPRRPPMRLPFLTVWVRQSLTLLNTPYDFTVPIQEGDPRGAHKPRSAKP